MNERGHLKKVIKDNSKGKLRFLPVTPVDVVLKDRNSKHVHVVTRQHQLTVFSSLQIYALNFVCAGITPIQKALLHIIQH